MTWTGPHTTLERFVRYARIATESLAGSPTYPSTERQFDLLRLLQAELQALGASDISLDAQGYVMATLPSTVAWPVPTICFCSHVDTSQDVSGIDVKPRIHDYKGGKIDIDPAGTLNIDPQYQPYLAEHIGRRVVTASGDTLLGADDKAGVAAIMEAAAYLLAHPELPHGPIRILFTPDEEIGRGVDFLDMAKLGADFGYTLDGGEAGSLEGASFSADGVTVQISGISTHPGIAKGKLVSAVRAGAFLLEQLPHDRLTPETTSGVEGFIHCVESAGTVETTTLRFLLRDFQTALLESHFAVLEEACAKTRTRFPGITISVERKTQYRNMAEILADHPQVMAHARTAIRRLGLEPIESSIRGGTDGSRLSFMGLPCPNLFTGMQMIHSRREWVGERDLDLAASMVVELASVWAQSTAPTE